MAGKTYRLTRRNAEEQLHCKDGPARIDMAGNEEWWINGIELLGQELADYKTSLRRQFIAAAATTNQTPLPADPGAKPERIVDDTLIWSDIYGEYHNDNGPAVLRSDGHREYYKHGRLHNTRGPARIYADGREEWWLEGLKLEAPDIAQLQDTIAEAHKARLVQALIIPAGTVITTPKLKF